MTLAPATHRHEFRRDIPWRVALLHCPPPLVPLGSVLPHQPPFHQQIAANGELLTTALSHKRAHSSFDRYKIDNIVNASQILEIAFQTGRISVVGDGRKLFLLFVGSGNKVSVARL